MQQLKLHGDDANEIKSRLNSGIICCFSVQNPHQ